jgi:hypothetical protein
MTLPVIEHFGDAWPEHGAMSVRFKAPVYDGEEVEIESHTNADGRLEVSLAGGRATGVAWMEHDRRPPALDGYATRPLPPEADRPSASDATLAAGTVLGTLTKTLVVEDAIARPEALLTLSNELLIRNVVLGPWIHTASEVINFSSVHNVETLSVHGSVLETYERKGRGFIVLDVRSAPANESYKVSATRQSGDFEAHNERTSYNSA